MLRNKVSPNDESVHSQSKDERKREAARSPEPVNHIDILTYHIIVFALCQIFRNRAGHQAVCWPWPWPWIWWSSALVHVPQFTVSYQTRIQRSWSTGRTILLKDKSQSWPTSRSCLRVSPFFCCKFIFPLQATLFPPLIPAVVSLKRAARWTGRQWSSFYQMTFFNAYCVLQENCQNMQQ